MYAYAYVRVCVSVVMMAHVLGQFKFAILIEIERSSRIPITQTHTTHRSKSMPRSHFSEQRIPHVGCIFHYKLCQFELYLNRIRLP